MNRLTDWFHESFYRFKKRHPRLVMTTVIFIVVPLAAGLILGYEMSDNVTAHIPTVIVDHDHSDFSRDLIRYIDDNAFFHVIEYADRDDRVKELMDRGEVFVGVIIPENFYADMLQGKAPSVLTIYDGSAISVVTSAKSAMTEILLTVKGGYMMNIYAGKQNIVPEQVMSYVTPIDVTYRTLFNPTKNFRNYVLPGMLVGIIQVGISIIGAERGWEKQKEQMPFYQHLQRIIFWGTLGAISIVLCLGVQYMFFDMPYKGTIAGGLLLTWMFSICITTFGYCVGSFISDRMFASQIASLFMLPTTILGGYTWPTLGMPEAFRTVAKCIPFYYFGDAVRALSLKEMEFRHLAPYFSAMCVFITIFLLCLLLIKVIKKKEDTFIGKDEYDLEVDA